MAVACPRFRTISLLSHIYIGTESMKRAVSLVFILLALAACSKPVVKNPTPLTSPQAKTAYPAPEYKIQVGDQLDIKFFYNPELNEQIVVRPDGKISLQLVNEVMAAGLAPAELTNVLKSKYAEDLADPEVTVIVRSFSPYRVYVDGEVNKVGVVALNPPMSVMQSITEAGGLKEGARANEIIVIRRKPDNTLMAIPINIETVIDGTDMGQDINLAPYDIVYVPRSAVANAAKWVDMYLRRTILVLPSEFFLYYAAVTR